MVTTEFPTFTEVAPLTAYEVEALRSLFVTVHDLRHEYESATAVASRMYRMSDNAEIYTQGRSMTHHPEALFQISGHASRFEISVGQVAWRYASASAVLGTTLLDRLVNDRPALTAAVVAALCDEPTLGDLHRALSTPTASLLIARDPDMQRWHDKDRSELLTRFESVFYNAARMDGGPPVDDATVAAGRLSEFERSDHDPLFEGLLEPLIRYSEQFPNEISWYLKQSRAGALSHQLRT
ncbi:hypothetical protein AB0H77_31165 [Streptomyces sp. NPDC050844]|uniref:hypothetical protein n=1 Tax=Streptomyces sp. NPDC050844 TaxID=3155790 RepID=UPI0033E8DAF9